MKEKKEEAEEQKNPVEIEESKFMMIDTTGKASNSSPKAAQEESYEIIENGEIDGLAEENDVEDERDAGFINLDQRDLELEVLSNIDPNDEFLQSERSFSLIEGVSVNDQDYSLLSDQTSEFSVISGSKIHQAISATLSQLSNNDTLSLDGAASALNDSKVSKSLENSALKEYLNASRFSVVNVTTGDTYAEDVVI